jgi:phosphoribosylglycinamide formyltransferase-1
LLNIGWFSTGRDKAARQLLQAVQDNIYSGNIHGRISFVFSNREPGESQESDLFFELARSYNLPLICFSHRKFQSLTQTLSLKGRGLAEGEAKGPQTDWRLRYDREVRKRIGKFVPDVCVLAGYMLIIGEELCQEYSMINLHPAPPGGPAGSWQQVIWDLIQNKAQKAGAMIHLVTPELDRGPVVAYCTFPIKYEPFHPYWQKGNKDMLFQLIRQHELAREFPLIISTLKTLSQKEISISSGKVIDAQGKSINGYDLSEKVNNAVEGKIASLRSQ